MKSTATMDIIHFPSKADDAIGLVGGKAKSLMLLSTAGFPVPPGFVLGTGFFAPWIQLIKETATWKKFLASDEDKVKKACESLKVAAMKLTLNDEQDSQLQAALRKYPDTPLFAVRSSAPEEDLAGASFAGGYATVLGVTRESMLDAIRTAFASCLDYRIFVYKKTQGFDPLDPKIAIVVQTQIASDVSGVGFSLNPLTNDYDEAVINSNWGLGETVVSGVITPDTFILSKVNFNVLKRELGSKEFSLWLRPEGNVEEKKGYKSAEPCLNRSDMRRIMELIIKVENHFGRPIDIEWAFHAGVLYLLQARPITAYFPVPPDMMTAPGKPRRLFLDATISVQGIPRPMTVFGTSVLKRFIMRVIPSIAGVYLLDNLFQKLALLKHGRMYLSGSVALTNFGRDKFQTVLNNLDSYAADSFRITAPKAYINSADKLPLPVMAQLAMRFAALPPMFLHNTSKAKEVHQRSQAAFARYMDDARLLDENKSMSFEEYVDTSISNCFRLISQDSAPLFLTGRIAMTALSKLLGDDPRAQSLTKALPYNMTVEMGLELARLSRLLPSGLSLQEIQDGISQKSLPQPFLQAWGSFLTTYGHRGPLEIDAGSTRYADDPAMLITQIAGLSQARIDPIGRHAEAAAEREAAYASLLEETKGPKRAALKYLYEAIVQLGGYRENHKYFLSHCLWCIKRRALKEAASLVTAGKLTSVDQIYDLTIEQLIDALKNPNDASASSLQELIKENTRIPDTLRKVSRLPQLFDSRGRILQPPPVAARPGELVGTAISPGKATGVARVLHTPDEKVLHPGEVLVARATDPGWTPLFANASAVVLEVGGMLQHGALVAREYGLPCVAGIAEATTALQDDMEIEVDGDSGIVRILAKPTAS